LHPLNLRKHVAVAGNEDCAELVDIAEHQFLEDVDQDLGEQAIFLHLIQQISVLACYWLNVLPLHCFFEVGFPLKPRCCSHSPTRGKLFERDFRSRLEVTLNLLMLSRIRFLSHLRCAVSANFCGRFHDVCDGVVRLLEKRQSRKDLVVYIGDEEENGHFHDTSLDLFPFG